MTHLNIRTADAGDVDRIIEVLAGAYTPGDESVALLGSADAARRFGAARVRLIGIPNPHKVAVVAEADGRIVGVLQYSYGEGGSFSRVARLRVYLSVLGVAGLLRRIPVLRARSRVSVTVPDEAFFIANVQVDPAWRGKGVGGQLLDWADGEARRVGAPRMALVVTPANPARRLYERKGFVATCTALDPTYERLTGVGGRVLMEKDLAARDASAASGADRWFGADAMLGSATPSGESPRAADAPPGDPATTPEGSPGRPRPGA